MEQSVIQKFSTPETAPIFIFASLLSSYPDERVAENVGIITGDSALFSGASQALQPILLPLVRKVKNIFADRIALDDLQSEYIDIFDRGRHVTSLYETEYGRARAMVKGAQLVDIAGFYHSFGFETGGEGVQAEMIDHISVELEFYALLCLKFESLLREGNTEGVEIVLDARKKFLKAHLGRFVSAVCERPGVKGSSYFHGVFEFCRDLVLDECKRLGVEVEQDSWLEAPVDAEEMNCGGSVGMTPC